MKDYKLRDFVCCYEWIKRKVKTKYIWGVGVMKDYNLTPRNLRASHTLKFTRGALRIALRWEKRVVNCERCSKLWEGFEGEKTFQAKEKEGGGKELEREAYESSVYEGLPKPDHPMTTVHAAENGPTNEPTKLTNDSDKGATKQPQGCGKSCAYVIAVTLIVSLSVRQELYLVKQWCQTVMHRKIEWYVLCWCTEPCCPSLPTHTLFQGTTEHICNARNLLQLTM